MRSAAIALMLLVLALPARADHFSIHEVQNTITEQITAFRSGDHARAYELSAPNVRKNYPTLASYMALIKDSFQPIANARAFVFGPVDEINISTITQEVIIEGSDGGTYQAFYTLELQGDGVWRITGVTIQQANDRLI
jgi:hypothetical protein